MSNIENLIQEIRQITVQYKAEVGSRRRPWPASIRSRVDQLKAAGLTWKEAAEKTSIPYYTIMQWRQSEKDSPKRKFHALPVLPAKRSENRVATVTVTTPDGYRIQADEVSKIAQLISILRKGD